MDIAEHTLNCKNFCKDLEHCIESGQTIRGSFEKLTILPKPFHFYECDDYNKIMKYRLKEITFNHHNMIHSGNTHYYIINNDGNIKLKFSDE